MPQIHPVPIRGKKCLRRFGSLFPNFFFLKFHLFRPLSRRFAFFAGQNAWVDQDLRFPIFYFRKFHLFRPCLRSILRLLRFLWLL